MRGPLLPSRDAPTRHQASAEQQARIVLMESISERERPVRHRKEQVTALRTIVRAVIWVAVLLTTLAVLTWRMMAP
jgi:hypothetical protein